jgi:uncharacterized protein YaiL (DUF2058 family)
LGLVDDKRANQAKQEKRKQDKRHGPKAHPEAVEERRMWAQQEAEKAARDRELNRQKQEAAARKAALVQIKQLVEAHRLPKNDGEVAFNFVDRGKVKRLYVSAAVQRQLAGGSAQIVRLHGQYDIVPAAVADRIRLRDPDCVIAHQALPPETAEDDPYGKYQIPDDLMW